ncbi:uncharacterized protein MELLADRAFT_90484 [Melampsora larici-populina 98AG31]|uniref:Uncharacterized protein n=1 Tax=Melampsora larici-populina (strain 98AG31 / pathotype 3-4-7) TaxID=747676 RepID=F4RX27_MELLP|nr:uncharacterized protein MELLADRAFT_90484 [Melampsora larici-populina 98AG31]EGG02887.1 hypothetical protein MELLADRAFT_90484 [Melampsora larici-populina 98AG31]
MSDAPATSTTATKRKSTGSSTAPRKKAAVKDPHASARDLVASINESPLTFTSPEGDDEVRKTFVAIAAYTKSLEPVRKSASDIEDAKERLNRTIVGGIKKLMTWKPSCKTGSAKFSHDGICTDPMVFGALLGLDDKPNWKMKKYTINEIENILGEHISKEIRYDCLYLTSDVNVRWNEATGEFKFTGSYGKPV